MHKTCLITYVVAPCTDSWWQNPPKNNRHVNSSLSCRKTLHNVLTQMFSIISFFVGPGNNLPPKKFQTNLQIVPQLKKSSIAEGLLHRRVSCLTHSVTSLSPKCRDLLEGVQGRCRNIDFVIAFTHVLLVKRRWILSVSLAVRTVEEARDFFPLRHHRHPKHLPKTSALSLSITSEVQRCLTGQEQIQFDQVIGPIMLHLSSQLCRYIPRP